VSLEVRDSGNGMEPDVLDRIFEPFFTTKFTGRGLGLSAVLGIVRGHHGALGVESSAGSGTRFRVLLPALPASKGVARLLPDAASLTVTPPRRNTVLLVDDEEMVREVGTAMLERLGHQVLMASNGHEALGLFVAWTSEISCVILDLTMPGPDSAEVLRAMRAVNPRVPVIVSSGFTEPEAAARVTDSVAFLQKPYELPQLREVLQRVVRDSATRSMREVS
jgi:two-component system, cell cycle sensor histidine kinase and response regulator CckA